MYPKRTPLFSSEEKLLLCVDWLLVDVAERPTGTKNPTSPLGGVWIEYDDPQPTRRGKGGFRKGPAQMRGSDLVARRYVAISVLQLSEWPLEAACNHVATRLYGTGRKADSIRTGFAKCASRPNRFCEGYLQLWITQFDNWLNWEIKENLFDRGISLSQLFDVMQLHVRKTLGAQRAMHFLQRYKELVARAVILLDKRIERETI